MFLVALVCLFVCLFTVGEQHYSKCYEQIRMKFYGGILGSTVKNRLKFGGVLHITRSTWRVQTSLAEADHYSHISHVIMFSLGCERLIPKVLDHYLHHDLGMLPLL